LDQTQWCPADVAVHVDQEHQLVSGGHVELEINGVVTVALGRTAALFRPDLFAVERDLASTRPGEAAAPGFIRS